MQKPFAGYHQHISLNSDQLLANGEVIALIDDDEAIRDPLRLFLEEQHLPVIARGSAAELMQLLESRQVALILLDIGLPDTDGASLIPSIAERYPDTGLIMLTGVADLQVAMDCIRKGADDYLTKPVKFNQILFVVKKTLEKRRLIFENRKYQEDLEKAHFRIQLMHQLSLKMNTVYLSTVELDEILQAILVGITANEGLRFNRAFLALFDDTGKYLVGRMAIGTTCRERAARIWAEMRQKELQFLDIVNNIRKHCAAEDTDVNLIIQQLKIPLSDTANVLIRSALERRSFRVDPASNCLPQKLERRNFLNGQGSYPTEFDRRQNDNHQPQTLPVPTEIIELLNEDHFVVVPLYSPGRAFGVIIADNFVTRQPITDSHINALELFASQASLAIEHSHLYTDMQKKIHELEELNHELDRNKDMLIAAERYAALGQMAAQTVHIIRNPVTVIGGISRILAKKLKNDKDAPYFDAIIKETARLELTLQDLLEFVADKKTVQQPGSVRDLVTKTLALLQSNIARQKIEIMLHLLDDEPAANIDTQQIGQMVVHLFKNALEAMPDGGILTVEESVEPPEWLVLTISDTGKGIDVEYMNKVTDTFFTTKTYGTGLGLSLVGNIIKAHGGTFELIRQDIGMKVIVRLPLCGEATTTA